MFCKQFYRYKESDREVSWKIKQLQSIGIRYDKNPNNFLFAIKIAFVHMWIKIYESMPRQN